jgi:hypothetical protein
MNGILALLFLLGICQGQTHYVLPHWAEDAQEPLNVPFGDRSAQFGPMCGIFRVDTKTGDLMIDCTSEASSKGIGPDVQFMRYYRTRMAIAGIHAPGMPDGWTHDFYLSFHPKAQPSTGDADEDKKPGYWDVAFQDNTGSQEPFEAEMDAGAPTGRFKQTLAPYTVTGVPDVATKKWKSLTLSGYEQGRNRKFDFEFIPSLTDPNFFHLHKISAKGHFVTCKYQVDDGTRLIRILDEDESPLMEFGYDHGWLVSVTADKPWLSDTYHADLGYDSSAKSVFLTSETKTFGEPVVSTATFCKFHYGIYADHYLIDSVSVPFPFSIPPPVGGQQYVSAMFEYDQLGRITAITPPGFTRITYDYSG